MSQQEQGLWRTVYAATHACEHGLREPLSSPVEYAACDCDMLVCGCGACVETFRAWGNSA